MRVGPGLVTGGQGWEDEAQQGASVAFPSHRPGNNWENWENPPGNRGGDRADTCEEVSHL